MLQVGQMLVQSLRLDGFRNYAQLHLQLGPGLHVFEGRNAQGKTALLEAIYLSATARSFRTNKEDDLIGWGLPQGFLELELQRDSGRSRNLKMVWPRGQRREIRLQDQPVRKLSDFLSELPLALFTPDDLELVQGAPQLRRSYLDLLLCKLYPAYLESLGRYQRVIRQKSALLKTGRPHLEELDSWDGLLVELAEQLLDYREELCRSLDGRVGKLYETLSGEPAGLSVAYLCSAPRASLGEALRRRRSEELRLRSCLVGPHRDDLDLCLGGKSVRRFGSQGQRRTLALALRLAQAEVLQEVGREKPVVLLDDCFSELDPDRQARLLGWLEGASQVLITTATPLAIPGQHRLHRVDQGQVFPC